MKCGRRQIIYLRKFSDLRWLIDFVSSSYQDHPKELKQWKKVVDEIVVARASFFSLNIRSITFSILFIIHLIPHHLPK
jgi:hypothetical protein